MLCVELASSRPNRIRPNDSIVETGTDSLMNMHLNETIITRVNEALNALNVNTNPNVNSANDTNPSAETHSILNSVLPPIISSVVSAVSECLNKFFVALTKREVEKRDAARDEVLRFHIRNLTYHNNKLKT